MEGTTSKYNLLQRLIELIQSPNSYHFLESSGINMVQSVFVCEDTRCEEYACRIVVYEPNIIVCKRRYWESGETFVVIVNVTQRRLLGVYKLCCGKSISLIRQIEKGIVDLTRDGCRWEGDCQDNKPFGWGYYYNSQGNLRYEGFRIGPDNICFGTYYYVDRLRPIPEYIGEIAFNQYHGRGKKYDRNGI